jgi:protein O-mannosyl-transferase
MRRPFFLALVCVVPLAVYARTATFDYVNADDVDLIVGNQTFLRDFSNMPETFRRSYFATESERGDLKTYYRPIAIASFMIDAQRGGATPAPYHTTNILLHAAGVLLLYVLLVCLGASDAAATAGSLIFAVHPLNTQAVSWIAGRNELLFGAFTLTAMIALIRWMQTRRVWWLAVHVCAFALALFSKETAVLIPVIATLYAVLWRHGTRQSHSQTRRAWTATAMLIVGYGMVGAIWFTLREQALSGAPATAVAVTEAAANTPQLLVHLGKLLAPIQLNVMPGIDRSALLLGVLGVLVCVAAARYVPGRVWLFCAAWILLFILPTLFVPDLPVYEHRMYVPMMGAAIAVSQLLTRPATSRVALVVCVALVVAFALQTLWHSSVFRNPFTYWENGTRSTQFAPIAHVNLGQLYEQGGNLARARDEYGRALTLNPDTPKAHNNLGVVAMRLQDPARAVEHFREETRRHPQNADAWFNLGLWAEMQGDAAQARRYYQQAIAVNRAYLPAYEKLGIKP